MLLLGVIVYGGLDQVGQVLGLAIVVLGVILLGSALRILMRRLDPYSLEALRNLAEREKDDPDEYEGEYAGVVCPYCQEHYTTEYKACPRCKRSF